MPGTPAAPPIRVQGRPEIFSTATLDLIVAGQTLVAFDRALHKAWESKLAHPLAFAETHDDAATAAAPRTATRAHPCLEEAGRLYLFDKGFLSTFESATGKALWRLPSIGIQKAQLDGRGTLYLSSANGSAEALKYAALDNAVPQLLKVEAATGKIRWKLDKYQDCFVSGGDLYATRETRNAQDAVNQVFDRSKAPQCRFKLYKLSARDGEPQWEWFQTRRPLRIECEGKKVSLLFADELQVLKSIAL